MEITSVDCPKCGGSISEEVKQGKLFKCGNCGSTLVWPDRQSKLILTFGLRLCPACGIDNEQSRNFCRNCGSPLTKSGPGCNTTFYVGDSYCPNGHHYDYELQMIRKQELLKKSEFEKQERLRVEKLGIEVLPCPQCKTLNSVSYIKCVKCNNKIDNVKPIPNPYL